MRRALSALIVLAFLLPTALAVAVRAPRTHTEAYPYTNGRSPAVVNEVLLEGVPPVDSLHYSTKSGTSMATPHVAGVVGLVRGVNPDLSPDQVHRIFVATASPLGDFLTYGAGMVDAGAAVAAASPPFMGRGAVRCPWPPIASSRRYSSSSRGCPDVSERRTVRST